MSDPSSKWHCQDKSVIRVCSMYINISNLKNYILTLLRKEEIINSGITRRRVSAHVS